MALVDRFAGVIFDYGGVLVSHQTKDDVEQLAGIAGIDAARLNELYWADRLGYDKGDVLGVDYWAHIGRLARHPLDGAAIHNLIDFDSRSWMKFHRDMYAFVAELRAGGKRVAVLSNMPRDLGEAIKRDGFGFTGFDHVTLSYEVRSAKPEVAIYQHCLNGIGTPAGRTLFLDDRIENIRAAQALGIEALQFSTPAEMLPKLRG
jgi:putative hydrolase of the HAD superfamily